MFDPITVTIAEVNVNTSDMYITVIDDQGRGQKIRFTSYADLRQKVSDLQPIANKSDLAFMALGWLLARYTNATQAIANKGDLEGKTVTLDLNQTPNNVLKVE